MDFIYLEDKDIKITIKKLGAEIQSITKSGRQILWDGNPKYWSGHAPVLFPICGSVKDDKYIFNGKEYSLPQHGFARKSLFEIESSTTNSATFLLRSNKYTLLVYPFEFELRITYTLANNRVNIEYSILNLSETIMYFSIGAHEAYSCPTGIEDYDIIFPQREILDSLILEGPLTTDKTKRIIEESNTLPLLQRYFKDNTLIFKNLKSKSVTLRNRKTDESIKVNFEGFNYLLFWTIPGAPFICIEPWCGLPDNVNSDYDFTNKEGILKANPKETVTKTHSIFFD